MLKCDMLTSAFMPYNDIMLVLQQSVLAFSDAAFRHVLVPAMDVLGVKQLVHIYLLTFLGQSILMTMTPPSTASNLPACLPACDLRILICEQLKVP